MDKKNRGSRTSLDDSIDEFGLWKKIVLDLQRLSELRDSSDDLGLALDGILEGNESGSLVAVVSGSQDKWINIKVDSTFVPPFMSILLGKVGRSVVLCQEAIESAREEKSYVTYPHTLRTMDLMHHFFVVFNHIAFFV